MTNENPKYQSTKVIPLGSTAFRQPYAESHCKFLHGYRLQAKFWFSCNELDKNNWVVDFGSLKALKTELEAMFDHTTCIWDQDPERSTFEFLHSKGVIDLRVFSEGVGIEKFAKYCYDVADSLVRHMTNQRCWCDQVEVWEHEQNSAVYRSDVKGVLTSNVSVAIENKTVPFEEVKAPEEPKQPVSRNLTSPMTPPSNAAPQAAPLYGKRSNTYRGLFDGTSWGNKG